MLIEEWITSFGGPWLTSLGRATVDAWGVSRQTAAAGPGTQSFDGFAVGDRDGHDVVRGLRQGDIQQCSQPAAAFDFGTGPLGVFRQAL